MAVEAPLSKYRKDNLKIVIVICLIMALYCGYDGYFNDEFIARHRDSNGTADGTLVFNRKSPPFFIAAAAAFAGCLFAVRNIRIVADEKRLIISGKEQIPYDSIVNIDRTYFASKGYFIITYKSGDEEKNRKLSDRSYDNLAAVLERLVSEIS